jgi:hypothetical protein
VSEIENFSLTMLTLPSPRSRLPAAIKARSLMVRQFRANFGAKADLSLRQETSRFHAHAWCTPEATDTVG